MIEQQRRTTCVELMCRAYEVSLSGYYAWRKRCPSQRQKRDAELLEMICNLQQSGRGLYGSDRIYKRLCAQGVSYSRKRVALSSYGGLPVV